ncbi:hypothetical protein CORC01_06658 [Colletotrichum orchidophilum]|uniref:Uncharacterized protein n=1 Tax=Colletotrichum orchidophilum TaxID=1209926 RepID=A0A1G4B9A9_9PEZI|nr:uncharacterized protein CORC01_06658 [Colletotrichum orchidophilum]OHE97989.1 hypothetical protein CORC01_06658 [Colletotrichum orchidophilum]
MQCYMRLFVYGIPCQLVRELPCLFRCFTTSSSCMVTTY